MRVYVASTYLELGRFRDAAEQVIQRLGYEPEMLDVLDGLSDEEVVAGGFVLHRRVEYETASHHDLPALVFHIAGQAKPMRSDLPHDTLEAIRTENVWVERFKNGQLKTHVIKRVEDVEEFEVALSTALVHFQAASGDRAG